MLRTRSTLLERGAELRDLDAAFDDALAGRGRLVVVEGQAGQGKSEFVAAVRERAHDRGLRVLTARGGELERDFPFGVIRQAFEPVLAGANATEHRRLLGGGASLARLALGLEVRESNAPAMLAVVQSVYWLAANLAEREPLLIAVDDAHWADASSLRALVHLGGTISDLPIVLVVALRPVEPGSPAELLQELRAAPGAERFELRPLGPESVASIVRERLPEADEDVCSACHEMSGGNPLYLQELLRTVAAERNGYGAEAAAALRSASVPSLGDRVIRRIARLEPRAPALTNALAVLGDGAELSSAADLAGLDQETSSRLLAELRRIEVLAAEDPCAFVHPLVRRSVYDGLSAAERDAGHAAAARMLEDAGAPVEAVASHLAAVPASGSSEAATALVEAGEQALARAAPDEAARWFQRALDERAVEPPPAAILTQLGTTALALRDPAAIGHLQEALRRTEDSALRSRIAATLAETLCLIGRWGDAFAVICSARGETTDPDALAELAAIGAMATSMAPLPVEELDLDETELAELMHGSGWSARALACVLAAVAAHHGDGHARVSGLVDQALDGGILLRERGASAWAAASVLIALAEIDEYERGVALSREIAAAGRRQGSIHLQFVAADHRGWMHARGGDLAAAEAELRPGLDLAQSAGAHSAVGAQLFYLQDPMLERPSMQDVAQLTETIDLEAVAGTWTAATLMSARGCLRIARRDRAGGIEDLRASLEMASRLRMGPAVVPSRSLLALALPASEREEALALVAEERELACSTGLARPQGVALRAAGLLASGEEGIELLRESASLLEGTQARLEQARSLVALGAALRRLNRRADAREPLRRGLELARVCGAPRLAARAQDELRAAGASPRRVDRAERDALTASELRVARLAVAGASNPEIAQELLVSLKTVETHLSSAYAKLGLAGRGSRKRLAGALGRGADTFGG